MRWPRPFRAPWGRSHTWDDVTAEVCDVILTGMVALASLTPDARGALTRHVAAVAGRAGVA